MVMILILVSEFRATVDWHVINDGTIWFASLMTRLLTHCRQRTPVENVPSASGTNHLGMIDIQATTEWSWFFFYRTCNVFFICYAVILLQYSKSVWSKVGTLTVYRLISCILMPENCFRSGKSCKMYAICIYMFSSSEVSFQHFLN